MYSNRESVAAYVSHCYRYTSQQQFITVSSKLTEKQKFTYVDEGCKEGTS